MVAASALSGQIGWAEEVTFQTFVAPAEFHELISESLELDIVRVESEGIRTGRRLQHRWKPGTNSVTGDVETELHPIGCGLLLKHIFGDPVTAGAGPYTHTWSGPGTIDDRSLSVTVNRPTLAGADDVFAFTGCQITDWTIGAKIDEFVKFKTTMYGGKYDGAQSKGTATYPAGDPFVFTHASVSVGGAGLDVESFELSGSTGLKTGRHRLSATNPELPRQSKESERHAITGTLDLGDHVAAEYDRFVAGTDVAIVVTIDDGTASLVFTLNARIDKPSGPNLSGPDLLSESIPFTVYHATSDASAIDVVLTNADATI